jgi:hypothetical protein
MSEIGRDHLMRFSGKRWSDETFHMVQRIPEIESAPKTHELISSLLSIFNFKNKIIKINLKIFACAS